MRLVNQASKPRRRGHAVVETALMVPWIFFLFIGVLDFGFYVYASIATANAARAAALRTSTSKSAADDDALACLHALGELSMMPNSFGFDVTCASGDLVVDAALCPGGAVCSLACPSGDANCAAVRVTYSTPQLVPIPGVLMGKLVIARTATMRIKGDGF